MSEYNLSGGVNNIDNASVVNANGGVYYLKGNIGTLQVNGGVFYDQRQVKTDRIQIVTDKMSDKERERLQKRIFQLQDLLDRSNCDCEYLRKKLNENGIEEPSDNVLVQRIDQLRSQLANEREAHQKKIDELEWRLKYVTDIVNGRNECLYKDKTNDYYIGVTDDSFDVLFTLINEYPISNDVDMAEELGISVSTLRYIAKVLRLVKSPEARREARERLKRHGIDMIERRGGNMTKDKRKKSSKTTKKQK